MTVLFSILMAATALASNPDIHEVPRALPDAQGYWWLVCKGPFHYEAEWQEGSTAGVLENMYFRHGHVMAGRTGENLNPGECTWPDRGMSDTEGDHLGDSSGRLVLHWSYYPATNESPQESKNFWPEGSPALGTMAHSGWVYVIRVLPMPRQPYLAIKRDTLTRVVR